MSKEKTMSLKERIRLSLSKKKNKWWGNLLYIICSRLWFVTRYCVINLKAIPKAYKFKKQIRRARLENKTILLLFGSPNHSNLGDNAQTVCIHDWIKDNFKNYELFVFNFDWDHIFLAVLKSTIQNNDMIFLHSGYHITELYSLFASVYAHIFKLFPDNAIFFFPQTVNISTTKMMNRVKKLFGSHKKFLFAARDAESLRFITPYFSHKPEQLLLLPDIVTTWIGRYDLPCNTVRQGVLFCLRNDNEKKWSTEEVMSSIVATNNLRIELTDTTSMEEFYEGIEEKRTLIRQKIDYFAQFKIVVTDRYHGTIFAIIANTPVIVLDSSDHKLRSGVDWFDDSEFSGRIYHAKSLSDIAIYADRILKSTALPPPRPVLYEKYYAKLKQIIDTIYCSN